MYDKLQERFFDVFRIVTYTTYFLLLFGISIVDPSKLELLNTCVHIYIGIFLIYRFNRFRKKVLFNHLDRRIAFHAGLFIIITSSIIQLVIVYLYSVKNTVSGRIKNKYENSNIYLPRPNPNP